MRDLHFAADLDRVVCVCVCVSGVVGKDICLNAFVTAGVIKIRGAGITTRHLVANSNGRLQTMEGTPADHVGSTTSPPGTQCLCLMSSSFKPQAWLQACACVRGGVRVCVYVALHNPKVLTQTIP